MFMSIYLSLTHSSLTHPHTTHSLLTHPPLTNPSLHIYTLTHSHTDYLHILINL